MPEIYILGVSGFVGRNTAKYFRDKGYTVIGLSRTNPHIENVAWEQFDLLNPEHYNSQLYTEASIINCAANTSTTGTKREFRVNSEGAKNALKMNPDGVFIHISSSSIYDLSTPSIGVTEEEFSLGTYPFYNAYSQTKAEAEQYLLTETGDIRTIPPLSLRPHAVYGKDDTTLLPHLLKRLKPITSFFKEAVKDQASISLPGGGKVIHSLTHIDNLTSAIELALLKQLHSANKEAEAYNITDRKSNETLASVIAQFAEKKAGVKKLTVTNIPISLAEIAEKNRLYEIKQIAYDRTYSITKATQKLNYHPTGLIVE